MPFSLAFGAVGVPQRDLPTRPDEVSTLLAGGAVLGLGLTYTMQRDASFACMSGTTVYLRDAQKGGLRLSTWEAIKEAAVPGLVDALMALHHPLPIAPTIIRHVWKQGLSHLDDDPGALQLLVLPSSLWLCQHPSKRRHYGDLQIAMNSEQGMQTLAATSSFDAALLGTLVYPKSPSSHTTHHEAIAHHHRVRARLQKATQELIDVVPYTDTHPMHTQWWARFPFLAPNAPDMAVD